MALLPAMVLTSVVLALAMQGQSAARPPSASRSVPGIVEAPGGARVPGFLEVHPGTGDPTFRRDLREARRDIERRRRNGELSKREARQLRRQVAVLSALAGQYGRDGLSDSERRELQMHAQAVRSRTSIR